MKSSLTNAIRPVSGAVRRRLFESRAHQLRQLVAALLVFAMGASGTQAQSCVNALVAPSTPTGDFTIHDDGTVTHQPTGLQWMRCSLGQIWTGTTCSGSAQSLPEWRDALQLVRAVNTGDADADGDGALGFAGYRDWRLPNIKELTSIHEACRQFPALNEQVFPGSPSAAVHWSSTTVHSAPIAVWFFDFGQANTGFALKSEAIPRFVRLVRGGADASGYAAGSFRVFADGFELRP